MPIDREQIETALSYLEYQFLPSGEFRRRKQANAITVECFRNTCLEDFHSEGWISDNEIKNVNIETSARVEHLIATDKFDSTVPKELFRFCFEASYKNHTTKELPKPM